MHMFQDYRVSERQMKVSSSTKLMLLKVIWITLLTTLRKIIQEEEDSVMWPALYPQGTTQVNYIRIKRSFAFHRAP